MITLLGIYTKCKYYISYLSTIGKENTSKLPERDTLTPENNEFICYWFDEYNPMPIITPPTAEEEYILNYDKWEKELLEDRLLPFKVHKSPLKVMAEVYRGGDEEISQKVLEQLLRIKNNTTSYNNLFNAILVHNLYENANNITYKVSKDFIKAAELITFPNLDDNSVINVNEYNIYLFNWEYRHFAVTQKNILTIMANTDKVLGLLFYYGLVLPHALSNYPDIDIYNYSTKLNDDYHGELRHLLYPEIEY